jgi:IclR family transcriptional regulator, acetate operon repressor
MAASKSKPPAAAKKANGDAAEREYVDGVPRLLVLGKAKAILDAFSVREPELTAAELAARTGLPPSTCFRLVRNLAAQGLLEKSGDRYRMGLAVIRWASSALESRSLFRLCVPTLDRLRDETGESSLLCVREGNTIVLVAHSNSTQSVARNLRIGEVSPLNAGSTGKVFLAFDPEAAQLLPRDSALESLTANTITDRRRLDAEVEATRAAGFAWSAGEKNVGASGITAPVFDRTRAMVAAIGITGPANRMGEHFIERYGPLVAQAAAEVSAALGFDEGDAPNTGVARVTVS